MKGFVTDSHSSTTIKDIDQKISFLEQRLVKAKKREERFVSVDLQKRLEKRLEIERKSIEADGVTEMVRTESKLKLGAGIKDQIRSSTSTVVSIAKKLINFCTSVVIMCLKENLVSLAAKYAQKAYTYDLIFFELKSNVLKQEIKLTNLNMHNWRGRVSMLNSIGWFFQTKLNDQVNAVRCNNEAQEILSQFDENIG